MPSNDKQELAVLIGRFQPFHQGHAALLKQAKWNVKIAIVMEKAGLTPAQAARRLRTSHDLVRDAIGEDIEPRLRELLAAPKK